MKITDAIKFFGLPPSNEELDKYLTSLDIHERPTYKEIPVEQVVKFDEGYLLEFEERIGYEEYWGPALETGEMIFNSIQVYGPRNKNDFAPYARPLPYGLTFDSTLKQALSIFGESAINHKSGPKNHVYVWYNHQGITAAISFLPEDQGASFMAFSKAKLRPPKKLT